MGTAVVAEELPDADELDELYRLDASEPEPEDDRGVHAVVEAGEGEDDEKFKPEGIPHG